MKFSLRKFEKKFHYSNCMDAIKESFIDLMNHKIFFLIFIRQKSWNIPTVEASASANIITTTASVLDAGTITTSMNGHIHHCHDAEDPILNNNNDLTAKFNGKLLT